MPRTPRTEEQNERSRLKRLVERAAHLAIRGRALSEGLRRHDRQAAVYLMNLARQSARLLQQIPSSQVPTLRLPISAADAKGMQQHVLRHTRVERNGTVIMQFLVLSSDGRMRICTTDLSQPATRLWRDYDPGESPDDFDFDETADALATLLDSLEQVLAASEARLAERIAKLEQRRREQQPNRHIGRPALATSVSGAAVKSEAAPAQSAEAPIETTALPDGVDANDTTIDDELDEVLPPIAATADRAVERPDALPYIDEGEAGLADHEALAPATPAAAAPPAAAPAAPASARPPEVARESGWPDAEEAGITRRRGGFRLSRLGRTI
jgi:hypothetical protein